MSGQPVKIRVVTRRFRGGIVKYAIEENARGYWCRKKGYFPTRLDALKNHEEVSRGRT